jgi:hypothetical protein
MRTREDRAKDISYIYIYDTLQVFGASLEHLRAEWRTNVESQLQPRSASMTLKSTGVLFGALTPETAPYFNFTGSAGRVGHFGGFVSSLFITSATPRSNCASCP